MVLFARYFDFADPFPINENVVKAPAGFRYGNSNGTAGERSLQIGSYPIIAY